MGAGSAGAARRFALVVGENAGDRVDERLRFAVEDARRVLAALREVGGVAEGDAIALYGADDDAVRRAMAELEQRVVRAADPGAQVFVYVSSHADEGELHLNSSRLPLRELTAFLQRLPASVGVLVVDSCRSGAATRLKGLKPLAGTRVDLEQPVIAGRVVITSSGPQESAQESDALGGSFFTTHLVAALRGAADASGDGVVTLQEAYAYAYARTVESTFATEGGIQHPSFRVDLKGQGELVLSEPRNARGRLALAVARPGEWLVLGSDGASVVGRFDKNAGPAVFALPPGSYRVRARIDGEFREASVSIPEGGEVLLSEGDLSNAPLVVASSKGEDAQRWSVALGGWAGRAVLDGLEPLLGGEARLMLRRPGLLGPLDFAALRLGYSQGRAELEPRYLQREFRVGAELGRSFPIGLLALRAGAAAGAVFVRQTGTGFAPATGLEASFGAVLGLELRIARGVGLYAAGEGGGAWVLLEQGRTLRWQLAGSAGASFTF
jgi:hypothetical protein